MLLMSGGGDLGLQVFSHGGQAGPGVTFPANRFDLRRRTGRRGLAFGARRDAKSGEGLWQIPVLF